MWWRLLVCVVIRSVDTRCQHAASQMKCSAKFESSSAPVCDYCARKIWLRTQKVPVVVDPALGTGLVAVGLAQTRLAVPAANRRDALDSSRLYSLDRL
jgi:hypothetical protein